MLRAVCRECGEHRPCEHWRDGKLCCRTPVSMYSDGPKCHECRKRPVPLDWKKSKHELHAEPMNDYVAIEQIRSWNEQVYARKNGR